MSLISALYLNMAQFCALDSCDQLNYHAQLCKNNKEIIKYFPKENTLCITGEIDWGGDFYVPGPHIIALKKIKIKQNVTTILSSSGGEITNSIMIAKYLSKYKYKSVVSGFCSSSCAQFLFLGAKQRFIMPRSYASMHGGPFTDKEIDQIDINKKIKIKLKKSMKSWRNVYSERNIPIEITYQFPEFAMEKRAKGEDVLWVPNKKDYEKYGIEVHYCKSSTPYPSEAPR